LYYLTGSTNGNIVGTSSGQLDGFFRVIDSSGTTVHTRQFGSAGIDTVLDSAVSYQR